MFTLLLLPFLASCQTAKKETKKKLVYAVQKTDAEWKNSLPEMAYYILRQAGTERPFTGEYNSFYEEGTYACAACKTEVYQRQYTCAGAMIAFEIKGTEKEAFTFLNNLKLIKLAVSLGSTESLIQHPATMTHAGVAPELKKAIGITERLIRISIGVENHADLITDLSTAFDAVKKTNK